MIELGVNIDHVATVRQARRHDEPDPVWAAIEAQLAGAQCITMHLREDRRHVQDHDVQRVQQSCHVKLNLEMAATSEMVRIAKSLRPQMATLVPEGRLEITTEGGLDIAAQTDELQDIVAQLSDAGILTSAFIDADPAQVHAAAKAGFAACEIHTGPYADAFHAAGCNADTPPAISQLAKVKEVGQLILDANMRFNAGHALSYVNVLPIAAMSGLWQLHIGHSIISRSIFVGLRAAVEQMQRLVETAAT